MLTYFYNFLSVISSVHGVGSEGAKHCTCGLGTLSPSLPHQTNVDPESCPRIPCKTIFLCEIPAWKNRQLYKSLTVVICDLLNFRAIMPPPAACDRLFGDIFVYHWGKQGWRERQKKRKEKRLTLFSILASHHPLLALRAHLQPPALKSTLLARFSLEKPADDSLSTDVFSLYLLCFVVFFLTEFCEHSSEASTQERAVNIPPAVSISYAC